VAEIVAGAVGGAVGGCRVKARRPLKKAAAKIEPESCLACRHFTRHLLVLLRSSGRGGGEQKKKERKKEWKEGRAQPGPEESRPIT
jgi:hypothetical protein